MGWDAVAAATVTPAPTIHEMAAPRTRTPIPAPGARVRGSHTGRPVMALLDLLGRRWVLRILWELRDVRAASFRELQARCDDVSSSVLNQRLRELRAAGILTAGARGGYELTAEGRNLLRALGGLDAWAARWGKRAAGEP
jgi:DNA-binding HxlR family transcriptional regulator